MTPIIPSQPNLDTETCPTCGTSRDDIMSDLCSYWASPARPTTPDGEALRSVAQAAAKERQRIHGGTAPGRPANTSAHVSQSVGRRATEEIAEAVGMSRGTYERLRTIVPDIVDVNVIEDLEAMLADVSSDPCSGWSLRTPSNRLRVCERPAVWSLVIEYACGSDCVMYRRRRREEFCEKHMQSARDGSLWCTGCKATVTVVDAVRLGGESR